MRLLPVAKITPAVAISLILPSCLQYQTDTAIVTAVPATGGSEVTVDLQVLRVATMGPCSYVPYYKCDTFLCMPWGAAEIPGYRVWKGTEAPTHPAKGMPRSGQTGKIMISEDGKWMNVMLNSFDIDRSYRIRRGPGVRAIKPQAQ